MRLIFVAFLFLGWAFYELSGGSDFDPEATRDARLAQRGASDAAAPQPDEPKVVQAVALNLKSTAEAAKDENSDDLPVLANVTATDIPSLEIETALLELQEEPEPPRIILPSLIRTDISISDARYEEASGGPAPELVEEPIVDAQTILASDVRSVRASRVNVRGGPGTNYAVINNLSQGEEVEVLQDPGQGWVQFRPVAGGPVGWVAASLLTEG